MLLAALVAAPCLGIVDAEALSDACDVCLGDGGVGCHNPYADVCARLSRRVDGFDEVLTAVGIDGVVASVVGDKHLGQSVALGDAHGDGEHYAVTEGHDGGLHVLVLVVSLGDGVGSGEEARLEVLVHEVQWDGDVLDAQPFAMHLGEGYLACVVVAAIVEGNAHGYLVLVFIEQGDAVHSPAHNYSCILHILL